MSQAELISYIVQIRSKLLNGTYTPEGAFAVIWDTRKDQSYRERQEVHQALELPFEMPDELDLIVKEPVADE